MKVNVVRTNRISTIDSVFSPFDDTNHRRYLRERHERTQELLREYGGDSADYYRDRSRKMFEEYNSSEALRRNRAAMRANDNSKISGVIRRLDTIEQIQSANAESQRFIMAHPLTRALFHKQRVDGYSGVYRDEHTGYGVDHYDYRLATNGLVMLEKVASGEENYIVRHFYEELKKGDRQRDPIEIFTIADAWVLMEEAIEAGIDPVNPLGGTIG